MTRASQQPGWTAGAPTTPVPTFSHCAQTLRRPPLPNRQARTAVTAVSLCSHPGAFQRLLPRYCKPRAWFATGTRFSEGTIPPSGVLSPNQGPAIISGETADPTCHDEAKSQRLVHSVHASLQRCWGGRKARTRSPAVDTPRGLGTQAAPPVEALGASGPGWLRTQSPVRPFGSPWSEPKPSGSQRPPGPDRPQGWEAGCPPNTAATSPRRGPAAPG